MAGLGLFGSPDRERQDLEQYATSLPKPLEQASLMAKVLQTWPARLAQSAYSAVTLPGEVLSNPDTAMDVLSGARDMSQETFNRATDLASIPMVATTGAPAGALGAGPVRPGIRAYHGSPHDFDRFDLSKIGTGEGAQAYGRGLYFAENEAVAKQYRDAVSGGGPGRMYEVELRTSPERMLNWDASVGAQQTPIRDALAAHLAQRSEQRAAELGYSGYKSNPENFYDVPASSFRPTSDATAKDLQSLGIDGIMYAERGDKAGQSYVVFDDALIDILRKYGLAGLTAGGAVAASSGQSEAGQQRGYGVR